jgi:hypothetical protein
MFGIRIGGSGRLYLAVPLRISDEWWTGWKLVQAQYIYRLYGRRGMGGRVLLNDPTLPHPLTGTPSDPPRTAVVEGIAGPAVPGRWGAMR